MRSIKTIVITSLTLALIVVLLAFATIQSDNVTTPPVISKDYKVKQVWEMPKYLSEVSGISWLPDNQVACINDEEGIIFIYDLNKKQVIHHYQFNSDGDYEGITVIGKDAFVMRSDGRIFKVERFRESEQAMTTSYQTRFSKRNNMETLTKSLDNKSLITAPKEYDTQEDFKGFYHIDLATRTMEENPFLQMNMKDPALEKYDRKNTSKIFRPSDMAIHPLTKELFVLEGIDPKLVVVDTNGVINKVVKLHKENFAQPEGITFSPEGRLFISNEARKHPANIVEIELDATR